MEFECTWCHRHIEVERAGWPYIHSVALLHLHSCAARPEFVTPDMIEGSAAKIADKLDKGFRGC